MRQARMIVATAALAAAASCGSSLLGCATHVSGVTRPSSKVAAASRNESPALVRARLAERHETGATEARQLAALQVDVDAAFEEGKAALLAGNSEEAFAGFDRALELVMRSSLDVDAAPAFRAHVESLVADMNELTLQDAGEHDGEDGLRVADLPGDIEDLAPAVAIHRLPPPDAPFTIPMKDHPSVDAMIAFYSGRAKDRFEIGLQRFGLHAPTVTRILAEEGVPPDLIWLAMVESNYNVQAYSRAHARGLWQFIPSTGRRYGLKQDFWVDERSDFEKETRSAARYLRDLHGMFGDWHLAIAAYNAGEGKIGRAIRFSGKRDFWSIRQTRYIRVETKNYLPALLAVMTIMRNPAAYGVNYAPHPPHEWETCSVSGATDLATLSTCAGVTTEQLVALNPEIRRGTTPGEAVAYPLRVPRGTKSTFEARYAALPPEQKMTWHRHVVKSGETVASIARQYGGSTTGILAANRLSSATTLHAGRSLLVPGGETVDLAQAEKMASISQIFQTEEARDQASHGSRRTYRVRPGDTLSSIARRHGVSVSRLAQWNGLGNTNKIRVGQRLSIQGGSRPQATGSSSRTASNASRSDSGRTTHVVKRGDTLSRIAAVHGTTVSTLRAHNKLDSRGTIHPGDRLTIVKKN